MVYSTFVKCLQGKARIAWDELLAEEYPNDADRTSEEFDVALTCYLECELEGQSPLLAPTLEEAL